MASPAMDEDSSVRVVRFEVSSDGMRMNQILVDADEVRLGLIFPRGLTDTDTERIFTRHPLGHRDLSKTVGDLFNKWFDLEGDDETLTEEIKKINRRLNLQGKMTDAFLHALLQGHAAIHKNFRDSAAKPSEAVETATDIVSLKVIYKRDITEIRRVKDLENERFGELDFIAALITDPDSQKELWKGTIHSDRLMWISWKGLYGSLTGMSYFGPSFDSYTALKNTEWAMGETFHRNAAGTKLIQAGENAGKKERDELEAAFTNLDAAKEIIVPAGTSVEVIKPTPIPPRDYVDYWLKTVSTMPETLLLGTQAGKVAGSETNLAIYFGDIAQIQSTMITPMINEFYAQLQKLKILPDGELPEIVWRPLFEESETEIAERWHRRSTAARALVGNESRGDPPLMTIEEIRRMILGLEEEMEGSAFGAERLNRVEIPEDVRRRIIGAVSKAADRVSNRWIGNLHSVNDAMKESVLTRLRTFRRKIRRPSEPLITEILNAVGEAADEHTEDLSDAISDGFEDAILAGIKTIDRPSSMERANQVPPEILAWWEGNSIQWSSTLSADTILAIKGAVRAGLIANESMGMIEARISDVFEETAFRHEAIARTETIRAISEARIREYQRLGIRRLIFMATPDDRTSESCMALDGSEFTSDMASGIIPVHTNCRCTWIAADDISP